MVKLKVDTFSYYTNLIIDQSNYSFKIYSLSFMMFCFIWNLSYYGIMLTENYYSATQTLDLDNLIFYSDLFLQYKIVSNYDNGINTNWK